MIQPRNKLCAVSVDLDEIPNYAAIHGLSQQRQIDPFAVYDRALARLRDWAGRHQMPLTLFAIGRDLERPAVCSGLSEMLELGHELGNHSQDHRYDLTRLRPAEMRRQVEAAQNTFEQHLGVRPRGFRAPGYTTTDALYAVLSELDLRYSSSVFPCPPYYLAKVAAIVGKGALGKRSASLIDDPRVLSAPTRPYRVGRPYWRPGDGIIEVPMQTTPWLRLPFIGTSINLFGPTAARWMARSLCGLELINLELHGIDLLDEDDGLAGLAEVQPDLRVPLKRKLESLDAVIETLRSDGYQFVTLDAATQELSV